MKEKEEKRKNEEAIRIEKFNKEKQRLEEEKLVREEARKAGDAERKAKI